MNYTPSTQVIEEIKSPNRTLVVFSAEWCGPCKAMNPMLEKVIEAGYRIYKINIDEDVDFAAQYLINALPTSLLFELGTQIKRHSGIYMSYSEFEQFIVG
ncbi:MAG: thioredoxin family protein [Bacteroidia bacterium]|jgi:thioredoxin 1